MKYTLEGKWETLFTFDISYDGHSVVTVRQADTCDFEESLALIDCHILPYFRASQPGSTWGCDGIGYVIEKEHGVAFRHKSGIGPRKYQQGLKQLADQLIIKGLAHKQ